MNSIDLLGNIAFILIACSFLVKDILWLRLLSVSASLCSITYNFYAKDTPLWVPIRWNLFFMSLNFYHIIKIIYGKRSIHLSKKEEELYQMSFSQLNLTEYAKLIKIAEWKIISASSEIVHAGQIMDELFMIYSGRVDIIVGDKKVNELRDGQFIGEMSFLSSNTASATVTAVHPTELVMWKQKNLKELMGRNPSLVYSIQAAMGAQLTKALHNKNTE
jgi:hypothetical protein